MAAWPSERARRVASVDRDRLIEGLEVRAEAAHAVLDELAFQRQLERVRKVVVRQQIDVVALRLGEQVPLIEAGDGRVDAAHTVIGRGG